jgi:hypothetical protein
MINFNLSRKNLKVDYISISRNNIGISGTKTLKRKRRKLRNLRVLQFLKKN